jgi:hypothetical protein
MFRVNTTRRNGKRAPSPFRPATDISGTVQLVMPAPAAPVPSATQAPFSLATASLEKSISNFLEAETAVNLTTKPWLRLERGIRLQKYRAFTETYPGLSAEERASLYDYLVAANDARLLNTKAAIHYDNGKIIAIKGLKVIRTGDPSEKPIFKIDSGRQTKRHSSDDKTA